MTLLNYRELDWKLIGAALLLTIIGVLMIYSSQYYAESIFEKEFYLRQLTWLPIALAAFFFVIHLPIRTWDLFAYLFYGISVLLLIGVLFFGTNVKGSMRWIDFGSIHFAPADFAKVAILCALARFFAYTRLPVASKRRLALSAMMAIIPLMLILKQPDLGTSLVFWVILFALWFWSGLPPVYMALILSPVASLIAASHWLAWVLYFVVLLTVLFVTRAGLLFGTVITITNLAFGAITPFLWNRLHDYQKLRIITFLDPGRDPRGAGYQIIQSKVAIGSGGIFGKGFLEGTQVRLDYLPERHTDFIFSVLGEQFGLFGALVVIGLFGYIFYRGLQTAYRCRSAFISNLAFGATSILFFQFFINIGMTLGLMPVTGLPLPLVSYGGTSLVLCWVLIGLIVAADYHWQEY